MQPLQEFARRLRMLFQRKQFDADLQEEMRLHLDLLRADQRKAGLSEKEARNAARCRFGNETSLREKSRLALGWEWLEDFLQDIQYGVRAMLRSPGVTIVALLSLALGIGANTAIFSLTDNVLLKSLPVKDPQSLVLFGVGLDEGISDGFPNTMLYSYPFFRQMQQRNQVFTDVAAAFSMTDKVHGFVAGRNETEQMNLVMVSGSYFPMLGVQALSGRTLTEDDDQTEGRSPVAVVSYGWWAKSLGRDPSVLSKKLKIGSTIFSIVGVAPPEFFGTKVGESPDIWIPLAMQKQVPPGWDGYRDSMFESLYVMGRLKPGVSLTQASVNVNFLFQRILRGFSNAPLSQENLKVLENTHVDLNPMGTGFSLLRWEFSEPLKVLTVLVGLVLLIACANIANLLLVRSTARARELAVRQALGAGRARLIRQLLTESSILALAGGALGIAFASVASRLLIRMIADGRQTLHLDTPVDLRLLLFTFAVTLLTAVLFGTLPAFRATRRDLASSFKDGRGQTSTSAKGRVARILVVSQVALSLVLLVGAGLFVRTLTNLTHVDTGFTKENVLRMRVDASSAGYKEDDHLNRTYQEIEERVAALPGVRAASFSIFTFNEGTWNNPIWVQGYLQGHRDEDVHHNAVGLGYFEAMGIPVLAGRTFGPQDTSKSQRVGVIGETLARNMFPSGSPIGKHYGGGPDHAGDIEVIGVVKDVKYNNLNEPQQPGDYLLHSQNVRYLNDFVLRYSGDLGSLTSAVRQTIHDVDPALPIADVMTLDTAVSQSITNQRLVAQLSAFFALLALFLSSIGIYGLMSYTVVRRTNEIGLRMALGAEPRNVTWMVLKESLLLVAIGTAIGIPTSIAGGQVVQSMLFGLPGKDLSSLLAGAAVLLVVAAFAGYLPARRAAMVDPLVSLRYE